MRAIIRSTTIRNRALWTLQLLLSLLFLFAGTAKLRMPADVLAQQTGLPGGFMHFIAVAETLGALGLVLPGLLRVRRELTGLAAAGLVTIMIGAVVVSIIRLGVAPAAFPFVVGALSLAVARARWQRASRAEAHPIQSVQYRPAAPLRNSRARRRSAARVASW